jgi:N-acetylglucosaminyl-diphospho-decaprenol L-rhamnosyltransferase
VSSAVTVAVVSWNTRNLLVRCLRSLEADVDAGRATVVVVDNGSSDGSLEAVSSAAPWARVVDPGSNLGFGRAVNIVARESESAWIAAANADVAVEPGAIEALLEAGAHPGVGCVAPRLVLPDGATQHSVFPFPTVPFTAAFNLGLQHMSRDYGRRLCLEGFWDPDEPRVVPWAIGAFLLVRRAAYEAVGGFDERQWIYAEDLDLGWRLNEAGWTTRYEPSARVLHEMSVATDAVFGDEKTTRFTAATYASMVRRRGLVRTWVTAGINVAGAAVRVALTAPLALGSPIWRRRRDRNLRWLSAHLTGLRTRDAILTGSPRPGG